MPVVNAIKSPERDQTVVHHGALGHIEQDVDRPVGVDQQRFGPPEQGEPTGDARFGRQRNDARLRPKGSDMVRGVPRRGAGDDVRKLQLGTGARRRFGNRRSNRGFEVLQPAVSQRSVGIVLFDFASDLCHRANGFGWIRAERRLRRKHHRVGTV